MKKTLFLLLLAFSSVTSAQDDFEQGLKAMSDFIASQMKKAEECQKQIDKDKFAAFERNSRINDEQVDELCLVNRDKAEKLDDAYMEEALKDPEILALFECMKPTPEESITDDDDESFSHVCD